MSKAEAAVTTAVAAASTTTTRTAQKRDLEQQKMGVYIGSWSQGFQATELVINWSLAA